MTAPLFHVPAGTLAGVAAGDLVPVTGSEARHAATVRRIAAGEPIIVADGEGDGVHGEVVSAAPDLVEVRVTGRHDEPAPPLRLVLVQALAKGGRDEDAIEAATELGVDAVLPWQADRSIVRWRGPKADKAHQKWVNVVAAAAKQSRRSRTPVVGDVVTTRELVRRIGDEGVAAVVLHEEGVDALATLGMPEAGELLLVVGPEGGIGAEELDALVSAGARPVRLGPAVLRSSTAGPAAIAVVSSAVRWR